jgi:hypothetical protein
VARLIRKQNRPKNSEPLRTPLRFGTCIATPSFVDVEVHMSFEAIPILFVLSFLLTAGIAFLVDGVRRIVRGMKR